ncbi:nucleosome assembly protein 1-like 1-A isoform X1 [Xenopus laevis]|uniref:Nucleosome assembly protein 1-like 1 n=2 Tax=Xenopus laevis TaxID=8355 RepID=A0A974HRM0_XENLA|nr:nucleosome assembly protein 1-like 1-A isoform X1 [Xenopus laevis]OCT87453.1 hypothetical protein XELAEV_18021149mg [Xenopus laevis]
MATIDNKEQTELDQQDMEDVEDVEEEETGEDANSKARQLTAQMMQNPQVLAALQERLDDLVGTPTGYIESLPKVVKRRVNALKNLQVKCAQIEAKFYEEVHELERKYAALYQPLFDKRSDIINATYEPTEEECEWKVEEEDISGDLKEKAKLEEEKKDEEKEDPKGIPEFWLTVFKNVDLLSDMLQEHDEPILKHLKDIKVKFSDAGQPMSFTLEFYFEPNEFFTNEVLTKTYKMRSEPDESDPFSFDGPEIMGCTGCLIDWKKGKNVTLKTIKKKQKHKGRGTVRTVTKTVPNDSFFNFFTPPEVPENGELDDDAEAILTADFEIGHFLRERIIPRSVLYFTGEAIEDDDDDYDEEGEEADDELLKAGSSSLDRLRVKWQRDIPQITEENWVDVLDTTFAGIISSRDRMTQLNYLHRVYITPHRLHKFKPDQIPNCPRCNYSPADFMHMVWGCPVVHVYWEKVVQMIRTRTEIVLPLDPMVLILNQMGELPQNRAHQTLMSILCMYAKKLIAMHWKSPTGPTLQMWEHHIEKCIPLYKLSYIKRLS